MYNFFFFFLKNFNGIGKLDGIGSAVSGNDATLEASSRNASGKARNSPEEEDASSAGDSVEELSDEEVEKKDDAQGKIEEVSAEASVSERDEGSSFAFWSITRPHLLLFYF